MDLIRILSLLSLAALAARSSYGEPLSPERERQSFQLADDDLVIELVASEPDVVSPVAIAWDARGRLFVAEMMGYPETGRRGRIKRLEDTNGDGQYDKAIVFADDLGFPTSVLPYEDGVLVTDAPNILFLQDTDDDGSSDKATVLWTGFHPGSQQLRANALHWGLDNWIYGANGRCGGEISQRDRFKPISIRGRDFRFDV
ncbi:MAG TPA: PVC-type heme-binding CxxCH protein, partial [Pirellulales bacterium]|nr:PVC-type heme-binding CxxCH protein [Pirellulales bacterium]